MADRNLTLVTGAGGFIGGWVAEALYLNNEPVRAGVRSWSGAARPARFQMDIVPCNIMNPVELDEAMQGVSHVIHCAKGPDETIGQETRNVLEAAYRHGVKRFVHVSTTEVFGQQQGNIDETYNCLKMGDSYSDNKIQAEEICWEYYAKGLPVTIVRPSIVYGPFSKTFTVNLAYKLLAGNWGIFEGSADGICNLIYVTDLVKGIILAMQKEEAVGQVFILNGNEQLTWNQYFERFNAALGLPALKTYKSQNIGVQARLMEPVRSSILQLRNRFSPLIKLIAERHRYARRAMKFVETRMKTSPRVHDLNLYGRKTFYLSQKAKSVLGFEPVTSLDDGLRMSVQWLEQIGMRGFQSTKGVR